MDFKKIKELQEDFVKNPRENIKLLLEQDDISYIVLPTLPIFRNRKDRLTLFYNFYKEYSELINKIHQKSPISVAMLKDDTERLILYQRGLEQINVMGSYAKIQNPDETSAISLGRVYASSLELFWKLLKKLVNVLGLNPKQDYFNIHSLKEKIEKVEGLYDIPLPKIKSVMETALRNSVGHECTLFEPPKTLLFFDNKQNPPIEVARLTTEEVYELVIEMILVTAAIISVENTAFIHMMKPLLKLSDEQLNEFGKTGILTGKMKVCMYGSKN